MFRPIKIRTETGVRIFRRLEEATEHPVMNWPAYYARQICLGTIRNRLSRVEARAAGVAAAKQANIYVGRSKLKKLVVVMAGETQAPVASSDDVVKRHLALSMRTQRNNHPMHWGSPNSVK